MLAVALVASTAWSLQAPMDRRAVLRSAATATVLAAPFPAVARSKQAAAEKATQKATAKEAQQAMKEYKFAPRPELEKTADGSYKFKEGTVKAGSQGELSSYFNQKGASIQAQYQAERALASGQSKAEAQRVASSTYEKINKKKAEDKAKAGALTEDAKRILEYAEKNKDLRDEYGRKVF
tara:strand:- start:294 stop:833 length:540 start_codon:yes stop_codon:yes gene_type:complete